MIVNLLLFMIKNVMCHTNRYFILLKKCTAVGIDCINGIK